jgi:hypothetical protein
MKSEKLIEYIGQIDDNFVMEAGIPATRNKSVPSPLIKWVSVAAVTMISMVAVVLFILNHAVFNDFSKLPKLFVNTDFDGMGFEGHMAYHIDELRDNNPWTEKNSLKTLPVFKNTRDYSPSGETANGLSAEEMLAKAKEVANTLGLKVTTLDTKTLGGHYTVPYQAVAQCDDAIIEVYDSGRIVLTITPQMGDFAKEIKKLRNYDDFSIIFEYGSQTIDGTSYSNGLPLPHEFRFAYHNTSYEQALEITQYLFSKYGDFTGIKSPGYNLFASYTYSATIGRLHTVVFENAGSLTERILSYHFNKVYFFASDMGGLGGISRKKTDLSHKIGDYPIITATEARRLLLKGHYITTVPEELPGEEYIARVTLVYRTSWRDTVFMPYYQFFVEMPTMQLENGLKTFGVFYVPAVKSEFLENLPLWDGSFN